MRDQKVFSAANRSAILFVLVAVATKLAYYAIAIVSVRVSFLSLPQLLHGRFPDATTFAAFVVSLALSFHARILLGGLSWVGWFLDAGSLVSSFCLHALSVFPVGAHVPARYIARTMGNGGWLSTH